jgi:hypothetical protein
VLYNGSAGSRFTPAPSLSIRNSLVPYGGFHVGQEEERQDLDSPQEGREHPEGVHHQGWQAEAQPLNSDRAGGPLVPARHPIGRIQVQPTRGFLARRPQDRASDRKAKGSPKGSPDVVRLEDLAPRKEVRGGSRKKLFGEEFPAEPTRRNKR